MSFAQTLRYLQKIMLAILLFLLILVGWFGVRGVTTESVEAKKMSDLLGLDSTMLHREIDHMQWASGVSSFLLNKNESTLSVGIDQNKCKLGKWLNDTEQKAFAEGLVPEVTGLLAKIKTPHADLHASEQICRGF